MTDRIIEARYRAVLKHLKSLEPKILDYMRSLKKMKDNKTYMIGGFETWADFCASVGLSEEEADLHIEEIYRIDSMDDGSFSASV